MVITFVLPGWSIHKPIGGFKVVYEYANRLAERGHEINVVHPLLLFSDEARLKQKMKKCALQMAKHFLRRDKVKWFKVSSKVNILIAPSLREENIPKGDVIIATAWQTAEWVNRYNQDKGEKFYLIQHYENWSGSEERVKATWKMPLKKIVIARWLEEKAKELGEQVVAYIPNGLDFEQFHITQPIEKRNPKRIGMLYHKYDWKGSQDGIEALKLVKEKFPDLEAVFFSVFSPDEDIPAWVEFYENPKPTQMVELYNSCRIFLHPSWSEGWPLPPAEAMACGCALVTTDSLGVREYALHEKTALISEPKNPEKLSHNIIRMLRDNDLRISLAESGHKFIKNFTWEKAVNEFEKVLLNQK
jgi:glycosyltransferase involved in cell wall biosynthesis